ncbi:hypothetical protein C8R47DRAFT_1229845 [Mycena vitilis]|nr:hypothetical protein C8R47DRAFT_1229845 [Mycena vitilis]
MAGSIPTPTLPCPASAGAIRLLGTYSYPEDFEITLKSPRVKGNSYGYKTTEGRQPFQSFLFGEVCQVETIETIHEQQDTCAANVEVIHRCKLRALQQGNEAARIYFANDVTVLLDVMLHEAVRGGDIHQPWAERHESEVGDEHVDYIYFDCNPQTEVVNGPVGLGSYVVVDVTLHRHDIHVDERLGKAYTVMAHDVEVVHRGLLERAGLLAASSAQGARDDAHHLGTGVMEVDG